jgi:hypothetical protein
MVTMPKWFPEPQPPFNITVSVVEGWQMRLKQFYNEIIEQDEVCQLKKKT